jgi:hypothetical protein
MMRGESSSGDDADDGDISAENAQLLINGRGTGPRAYIAPVKGRGGSLDLSGKLLPTDVIIAPAHDLLEPAAVAPPYETLRLVGTIVKSFIGSGVLFLPKAFENGGGLFSILVMIFMAGVTNLCILRLVRCRERVTGGYGDVGM